MNCSPGSSPLARGLLTTSCLAIPRTGIIPARAGFTPPASLIFTILQDHPRSRGVYTSTSSRWRRRSGSSPLARGLLPELRPLDSWSRIIPARAGFTRRQPLPGRHSSDHPRSRGVYETGWRRGGRHLGSSPLARGLPRSGKINALLDRIIPARAGFTLDAYRGAWLSKDHPRSRGVYFALSNNSTSAQGSSPLARGLPE